MGQTHILRVPRTDEEEGYVLVQVTSNGRKDLDLKLVATDGLCPYVVQLKQGRVSSLKDKKHPCSENEWERILTEVLLDRQSDPEIEAAALVSAEQSVTLIVRRSISGIKQRIGTITLKFDEDEAIELFEWCGNSIEAKETVKADLVTATSKVEELESAVKELKDQLEELIEAKKTDETELLEKFRDLLNEKKVKIREQQRILMANDIDDAGFPTRPRSQSKQKTPEPAKGHKPKPSRTSKRKAAEPEPEPEPEIPESDDELDKMEVDKKHGEEDSDNDRATDDDATASDDDDEEEPLPDKRRATRSEIEKPPAANTRQASQRNTDGPPPPRHLPFNQRKAAAKPTPAPAEGSETESDDEL